MSDSKKKKVLIVEDEKLLAEMYQETFTQGGFDVVSAGTGKEAVDVAMAEKPDFVLLDIVMPEENGIFFLKEKSKLEDIASIPVVAFSNFDTPRIRKEALEAGALEYLLKTSYTPQQVIDRVRQYLEHHELS
jgi:DNA-binding response OmpR family regulator